MSAIDEARLEEFKGRVAARYTRDCTVLLGMWLGDEPALYSALAEEPQTPERIAADAGCSPRLVRDLLDGQVASGHINYHPDSDSYSLNVRKPD
jgi:hypothetical protein